MLRVDEQRLFTDALAAASLDAVSGEEANEVAVFLGMGPFVELCRGALRGEGQPRQRLSHLSRVARACTAARSRLRMPYATFDRLDAARTRDAKAFGKTFLSALEGNAQDKAVIKSWLAPEGEPERPPVHPTSVAPPSSHIAPMAPAPRPTPAPPRPPSVPTQAQRPTQPPAPQEARRTAPAAPTHRENVHTLRSAPEPEGRRTEEREERSSDGAIREYDQAEVYGRDRVGATALQVENSPSKKDRGVNTINLSIGRAKKVRTQDGVDWQRKIIVMLTGGELLLAFAVLNKLLPSFRIAGHGTANDKWAEVTEVTDPQWAGQVRVTIAQGKGQQADIRSVGIGCKDMPFVIDVFTRAGLSQFPSAENFAGLLHLAKRAADLYEKSTAAEQLRKPQRAAS